MCLSQLDEVCLDSNSDCRSAFVPSRRAPFAVAEAVVAEMRAAAVAPDAVTWNALLQLRARTQAWAEVPS